MCPSCGSKSVEKGFWSTTTLTEPQQRGPMYQLHHRFAVHGPQITLFASRFCRYEQLRQGFVNHSEYWRFALANFEPKKFALTVGIAVLLIGCESSGGVVGEIPKNRAETSGSIDSPDDVLFGEGGLSFKTLLGDNSKETNALPVNKYLWQASLNVLSASLPLASTDPFSGVIATDWGASANSQNERVRVTASVQGTELTARALSVQVFRETLNPAGAWIAAPVSPQTAATLKDSILVRARELRIQAVDGTVL